MVYEAEKFNQHEMATVEKVMEIMGTEREKTMGHDPEERFLREEEE